MARRRSALLNGGWSRLTSRWRGIMPGDNWQIACGICFRTSSNTGTVRSYGSVRSNLPDSNASFAVEGSAMIVYSMPSR